MASGAEQARGKPTAHWVAYDYFLQGRHFDHRYDLEQSITLFARAAELDPNYVDAHAWLGGQLCLRYLLDDRLETLEEAASHAQRALALDENDARAQGAMGWVALRRRQYELAGRHFHRSTSLNPHDSSLSIDGANWLMYVNRLDEALRCLDLVQQRDPYAPNYIWEVRGQTLYFMKRYNEAISALQNMRTEHFWQPMFMAAAMAQSGRLVDSRRELASLLRARPKETLGSVSRWLGHADKGMRDHLLEGLRKAGLPD